MPSVIQYFTALFVIMYWHNTNCNYLLGNDTNISTKWSTVVHNICFTKCNTIVVMLLLLWSYPGNGTKCVFFLLWPWLCDYHMHFQVVCLSVPLVKDPQIGNDSIHLELLMIGVIHWNKVAWVLATQRREELSVNS